MIFLKFIISFFTLFFACLLTVKSQNLNTNEHNPDTLYFTLNLSELDEPDQETVFKILFDSLIKDFNLKQNSFIMINDSNFNRFVCIKMSKTAYVSVNKSLMWTGIDLALIGVNILILPFPPVIPFYLIPSTYNKSTVYYTPDLKLSKAKSILYINPCGFWTKQEKQKLKMHRKFCKVISRFLLEIETQYKSEL